MLSRRFWLLFAATVGLFVGVAGLQLGAPKASADTPSDQYCVTSVSFQQVCSPVLGSYYYPYNYLYPYSYPYTYSYYRPWYAYRYPYAYQYYPYTYYANPYPYYGMPYYGGYGYYWSGISCYPFIGCP